MKRRQTQNTRLDRNENWVEMKRAGMLRDGIALRRPEGVVMTPNGIVSVASGSGCLIEGKWVKHVTRLYFTRNGRRVTRSYPRYLNRLGASIEAGKLAREASKLGGAR